jgi:solute carrier family 35 (UDP-galactose transporter), member B1
VADTTHFAYYIGCALAYLLGLVCSTWALQWVSYPTQVIAKAAQPIPVMLFGKLFGGKTYSIQKYIFVFVIIVGIVLFMFKTKDETNLDDQTLGWGGVLLLLGLAMDGVLGALEVKNMYFFVNNFTQHIFIVGTSSS